jgi:hypothetical protein
MAEQAYEERAKTLTEWFQGLGGRFHYDLFTQGITVVRLVVSFPAGTPIETDVRARIRLDELAGLRSWGGKYERMLYTKDGRDYHQLVSYKD